MLKVERMRETTCVARREWPPSAKKLSVTLTRGRLRTALKSSASFSSVGVRGATKVASSVRLAASGAGSSLLAIFPLGVRGRASSGTKTEGTMYSGSRLSRAERRASGVTASAPETGTK